MAAPCFEGQRALRPVLCNRPPPLIELCVFGTVNPHFDLNAFLCAFEGLQRQRLWVGSGSENNAFDLRRCDVALCGCTAGVFGVFKCACLELIEVEAFEAGEFAPTCWLVSALGGALRGECEVEAFFAEFVAQLHEALRHAELPTGVLLRGNRKESFKLCAINRTEHGDPCGGDAFFVGDRFGCDRLPEEDIGCDNFGRK